MGETEEPVGRPGKEKTAQRKGGTVDGLRTSRRPFSLRWYYPGQVPGVGGGCGHPLSRAHPSSPNGLLFSCPPKGTIPILSNRVKSDYKMLFYDSNVLLTESQ